MIKRAVKFLKVLGLLLILISSIFSLSGCATKEFTYGRVSTLRYHVNVFSKEGERLEEITLYLPFSRHKGELMPQVMESARRQILRVYYEKSDPKISLNVVDTKYGKMLKIRAINLRERGGFSFEGRHMYARLLPVGDASKEYPLEPVFLTSGQEKSYIYASFKGGTGFDLHVVYDALYSDQYLPERTGHSGKGWIIGKKYEVDPYPLENKIEVGEQGWVEVPVWSKP